MEFLDYNQLSERLSIKKSTLYAWVSMNKIPHVRISGRCVRFNLETITAWLKQKAAKAGSHE